MKYCQCNNYDLVVIGILKPCAAGFLVRKTGKKISDSYLLVPHTSCSDSILVYW